MKQEEHDLREGVSIAFEKDCIALSIESIHPLRSLRKSVRASQKYRQISASIREVGLVEPPVVARDPQQPGEAFTYNKRISRIAPVQQHKMIHRAIERGVSEEKIARALDINMNSVQRRMRMLDGICDEAVALLKDKPCPMAAEGCHAMARMETELGRLQEAMTSLQDSYGKDHLHLTVIKGYLTKLLANPRIARYLTQNRPEFVAEFRAIAEMTSTLPSEAA